MFFLCNISFSSMPVFLPSIIHSMNYSPVTSQALTAPPYLLSFATVLLTSHLSDKYSTRWLPLVSHALISAAGYTILAFAKIFDLSPTARYIPLYLACIGFFNSVTLIITWTLNNAQSASHKGMGMVVLNVLGQCGPLVGTRLYPETDKPWYTKGMAVCAVCMVGVAAVAGFLRIVLGRENRRRAKEWERRSRLERVGGDTGTWKTEKPFLYIL
jgi:hypothetical protein